MKLFRRRAVRALLVGTAFAALLGGVQTQVAVAEPEVSSQGKPTAAIALGDSYSSGEGGRWKGNMTGGYGDRGSTDAAAYKDSSGNWRYDPANRAYDPKSYGNHCHRSQEAPIKFAILKGIDEHINLACSGAESKHLWRLTQGGEYFKGEMPQVSQLALLRDQYDVKLITLGIGGNDIGFGEIIAKCVQSWLYKNYWLPTPVGAHCSDDVREDHFPKFNQMRKNVIKTIKEIRYVMRAGGYSDNSYRLVLVGYPSALPDYGDFKYSESSRMSAKCPFRGSDAYFVNHELVPRLNGTLEAAAYFVGADFLDLSTAFKGHELCGKDTERPTSSSQSQVGSEHGEWMRFLDASPDFDWSSWKTLFTTVAGEQGRLQESMHPNIYGQWAIAMCVTKYFANAQGSYKCDNADGGRYYHMEVTAQSSETSKGLVGSFRGGGKATLKDYTTRGSSIYVTDDVRADAKLLQVTLHIEHERHEQLEISLVRPDGSRKVLMYKGSASPGGGLRHYRFVRSGPLDPSGRWRVEVRDTAAGWTGNWYNWAELTVF